jgi:hypothetical protein
MKTTGTSESTKETERRAELRAQGKQRRLEDAVRACAFAGEPVTAAFQYAMAEPRLKISR